MTSRLAKQLEGWQAGLLAVLVAWVVAILVVPRHVEPSEVPLPRTEPRELTALRRGWVVQAERLERDDVGPSVRSLGGRLRAYGRAEYEGHHKRVESAREALSLVARAALHESPEDVAALEARYSAAFVRASAIWIDRGVVTDDLMELGGDAPAAFEQKGWKPPAGGAAEDFDVVLRALYRKRFIALVGNHPALAPPPEEALVLLRFLMARVDESPRGQAVLFDHIAEVEGLDPSYPAGYARGIVLFKLGRFEQSAAAFDAYLRSDTGAYKTRAANYLRAAVEEAAQ